MRLTLPAVLLATFAVAGCATAEREPYQLAEDDREQLDRLLEGRVAGEPRSCLFGSGNEQLTVIDDRTLVYRVGGRRYLQQMTTDCPDLDSSFAALVTTRIGGSGPCEGDIARVIDTGSGIVYGACAFGPFIPYEPADED